MLPRAFASRRAALLERSAAQRAALEKQLAPLVLKLAGADRAIATVRAHPVIAASAAGLVALLGWRRLARVALRVLPLYSLLRRL